MSKWGNTDWISQNQPAGEPCPLVQDSVWVGWACGGTNAVRARSFLKSATQPRTLWPDWQEVVKADHWWEHMEGAFLEPGIANLAKGTTGCGDDAGAED